MNIESDRNPILRHRSERWSQNMGLNVSRLIFEQVYDYAQWLSDMLERAGVVPEYNPLYEIGNILKTSWVDSGECLYVMVSSGAQTDARFPGIVLHDSSEYSRRRKVGTTLNDWSKISDWSISSFEEVSRAMG